MVMDSLGLFMGLSESTRLQICRIYNSIVPHHESSLKISKLSVQQQKGYLDCVCFLLHTWWKSAWVEILSTHSLIKERCDNIYTFA